VYSSFHQLYGDSFSSVGASDLIVIFLLIIHNVSSLVQEMLNLAIKYNKAVQEEDELPRETCQSECRSAGCKEAFGRACVKFDVVKHSSDLGTMLDTIVF
jgi:hypothetical protein